MKSSKGLWQQLSLNRGRLDLVIDVRNQEVRRFYDDCMPLQTSEVFQIDTYVSKWITQKIGRVGMFRVQLALDSADWLFRQFRCDCLFFHENNLISLMRRIVFVSGWKLPLPQSAPQNSLFLCSEPRYHSPLFGPWWFGLITDQPNKAYLIYR